MSSQVLLCRALLVVAFAAVSAAPATAQVTAAPDAVPEFVPYVNDLQVFDQPDLSTYGRGPRVPAGYFGSAEYLSWAQSAPPLALVGQSGTVDAIAPGASTDNSGDFLLGVQVITFTIATTTANVPLVGLVQTVTSQSLLSTVVLAGSVPSGVGVEEGNVNHGSILQTSSLDTTFMSTADYTSGGRFEFGRVDDDGRGWLASGFGWGGSVQNSDSSNTSVNFDNSPIGFVDFRGINTLAPDGIDDDLDHDGVYGRMGYDLGTQYLGIGNPPGNVIGEPLNGRPDVPGFPTDFDDAVRLPTKFTFLHLENRITTYGMELNRMWRLALGPRGGVWEFFVGPRGLLVNDQFYFEGFGQVGEPTTNFNTTAKNWVIGGQFGGRWSHQRGRMQVSLEARGLMAANYQHITQRGGIGSLGIGVSPTAVINVQLPSGFSHTVNQTEFAPGGELRFNLKYQLFRSMYVQAGYTALFVSNVARGSMVNYYNLPSMGILDGNNKTDFLVQGMNFGVVMNR